MAPVVRRAFLLVAATWVLVGAGTASAAPMGPMGPRVINGSNAVAGAWPGIAYLQFTPSAVPNGIAVDAAGNVFTADYAAGAVSKITPGTTPTVDIGWAMPGGAKPGCMPGCITGCWNCTCCTGCPGNPAGRAKTGCAPTGAKPAGGCATGNPAAAGCANPGATAAGKPAGRAAGG